MNIFIIEPYADGHRFHYLIWAAEAFLQSGHKVYIGTSDEHRSQSMLLELESKFIDQIHIISIPVPPIKSMFIVREIQYWCWFKKIFHMAHQTIPIDFVFIPFLDYFLYAVSFLGSPFGKKNFSGIIMTQSFHHKECGIIRPANKKDILEKILFHACFRNPNLTSILTIDPYLCLSPFNHDKLSYIPDPNSELSPISKSEAREKLSLENRSKIVLVFGFITPRKGINTLFEAVNEFNLDVHIILAGQHDESTLKLISGDTAQELLRKNKLSSVNEFISPDLETAYYCASDIIWLGYENHYGMSGVLIKSATCNKVVLACQEGLIGKLTNDYNLGITTNTNNPEDVATAINRLLKDNPDFDKTKMQVFAEQHSVTQFKTSLMLEYDKN